MAAPEILRRMPPGETRRLTETSDAAGLTRLALHLGLIGALALPVALRVPGWWVAVLPLGVAQVFLFTLMHECTHRTPFRRPWLSDWAGRVAGVVLLLPFERFRYFHLAHHRHVGDPDRDPELVEGGHPATRAGFWWHVSGLPLWWGLARQIWRTATGRDDAAYIPPRARPRVRDEARWMLALYALLLAAALTVAPWLWRVWVLPVLLGQPVLRLYLLAEHGDCPRVADVFLNTRTTLTGRAVRFLAWNMPYHAEHHAMPTVPFHRLPELHARTRAHLCVTAEGYRAFTRDFFRGLGRRPAGEARRT